MICCSKGLHFEYLVRLLCRANKIKSNKLLLISLCSAQNVGWGYFFSFFFFFTQSYCLWIIQYVWNVLNILLSFLAIMQDIYLTFLNLTYRWYCFSRRELSWFTRRVIEFAGYIIYQNSLIISTELYKTRFSQCDVCAAACRWVFLQTMLGGQ